MQLKDIDIHDLQPDPDQPRKDFPEQELTEMSSSLARLGQLVPIIVVLIAAGIWRIIDGERRWRAAQLATLTSLRAVVLDRMPDPSELCDLQLTINSERQDLNPIELLEAYKRTMASKGINATELAKILNKSKSSVTRILSLDRLSDEEKRLVAEGKIGSAGGYALARMDDESRKAITDGGEVASRNTLERLAKRPKTLKGPVVRNLRCDLEACSISVRAPKALSIDELIDALGSLIRACKQAKSKQIDLSTMSLMLRDQAIARNGKCDEDESCLG